MYKKFYVTTPIYYVNDIPHVGHAYTTLAADVVARCYRQKIGPENVFFLTGTDEHGANVAQAAAKHNKTPKEYADEVSRHFQESWRLLNIKPDYFIRTTDPRHEKIAQDVLQKIYDKGYIYPGTYEGWYCLGCERFYAEDELVNGKCPLHPTREPVYQKEKNYFLKLQELAVKEVLPRIEKGEYQILPQERYNEIVTRIKHGVKDISVSRAGVSWGIPIPWDKTQTIYVWVEALLNYYSATQFLEGKNRFWAPDIQFMAKDIVWFHSVIWQALLIAAGLPLPKIIFAHGFFTINGQKMSKSLGNVISPQQLVDTYGIDGSRFLLLSAYQFGSDGDLSLSKFTEKYNADLANGLGNLVARIAKLCETIPQNYTIKQLHYIFEKDKYPNVSFGDYENRYIDSLNRFAFNESLAAVWEEIKELDLEIENIKPWNFDKEIDRQTEIKTFLLDTVTRIKNVATLLQPFLPFTAQKILEQFKGPAITSQPPLFPRIP